MKWTDYCRDHILSMILLGCCTALTCAFLHLTGYSDSNIRLLLIFWGIIVVTVFLVQYRRRKRYFDRIESLLGQIDERYLLGELMPQSFRLEDRLYRDMIRRSNKAVIERIRRHEAEQKEYREYMESWVHEIKSPITGISLLCENGRKGKEAGADTFRQIMIENARIENYVDTVLYYARSENVYKDYLIRECSLQEAVCEVMEKNKLLLIQNGISAGMDCDLTVYTDRKWLVFILNQLVLNCIKYRCAQSPHIRFYGQEEEKQIRLTVEDNGIGIPDHEIGRIFEKGFTGTNGRNRGRSTGMGLYLCRKLCRQLGIKLQAESQYHHGTRMILVFPKESYISDIR